MNKCKMALLIDDPHQKFVYIYDPKTLWTFMIELLKIVPDDAKVSYPKIAKAVGESPKQHIAGNVTPLVEEEEFDEDEPHSDDEAYTSAHSEDETALLEGEEGEEEEVSEEEETHDDEESSEFEAGGDHAEEDY
jgi:hypothetical protein